jgi:site-specific DNA-cytosine methylase
MVTINKNEKEFDGRIPTTNERVFIMGIRLTDFEKSIDWNLVNGAEKDLREALTVIRRVIINRVKEEELNEKQMAKDYQDWANDPDEWKDARGE